MLANVLGPLVWREGQHLMLGCLGLGLVEGIVVARLLRVRMRAALPAMILANYASAWIGAILLALTQATQIPHLFALRNLGVAVALLVTLYFALTVALEWPFVRRLIRDRKQSGRKALRATLIAHVLTYSLLIAWYLPGTSLLWRTERVTRLSRAPTSTARIYFHTDEGIESMALDGSDRKRALGLSADADFRREFPEGRGLFEFDVYVGDRLIRRAAPANDTDGQVGLGGPYGGYILRIDGFGHAAPIELALSTAFTPYGAKDLTILPDDHAVVALGERICLLDLRSLEIVELARGHTPVVSNR